MCMKRICGSHTMEGMCQWYVQSFLPPKVRDQRSCDQMPSCDVSMENTSKSWPILSQSGQDDDDAITVVSGPASSNPGPPSEVVSTQLLQSSAADREAERERRRKNGNVPPREDMAGGKNLDKTCLRLAIERPGTTSGGRAISHYFCIACDKFRANNSRSRAFEHADQCNVSIKFNIIF
jgi:hypothetical protein